jgi:hypothetical protein
MKVISAAGVGPVVGVAEGSGVLLGCRAVIGVAEGEGVLPGCRDTGVLPVSILGWQALNSKMASVR